MKTFVSLLCLSLLALVGSGCESLAVKNAAVAEAAAAKVEVEFVDPEAFTDVKDALVATEKGRAHTIEEVRQYLVATAARHVPEGQHLKITVTDIDMAGDYEFWGRAAHSDIRIIKAIYPPSIDLDFVLSDAAGTVLKEGTRRLHDLAFQMRIDLRDTDRLRYEKALIDDWLRDEFGSPIKG